MAIAAKFSEAFYERFGHEVVAELVGWFNEMDLTSRTSLRKLNEFNFARSDAKLEQRLAELRGELRTEIALLRGEMHGSLGALRSEMHANSADLKTAFAAQAVVQMRWMVGMWAAVLLAIIGLWFRR